MDLTEDELRAAIKAMIGDIEVNPDVIWTIDIDLDPPCVPKSALQCAIDATHAARKRHPIEWPPEVM